MLQYKTFAPVWYTRLLLFWNSQHGANALTSLQVKAASMFLFHSPVWILIKVSFYIFFIEIKENSGRNAWQKFLKYDHQVHVMIMYVQSFKLYTKKKQSPKYKHHEYSFENLFKSNDTLILDLRIWIH